MTTQINTKDKSSKSIRVGIVGCGNVAKHHLRFLAELPHVEVVGLADSDEDRARSLGEPYGLQSIYSSLDDLLASATLDVLHILTPPQYHYAQTLAAVQRRINVFVEKPTALNIQEVAEMYDQASKMGVSICPDFIQLFHPLTQRMISLVESGVLGRAIYCECNLSLDLSGRDALESQHPHWSYELPGGILHNSISHLLYLALFWTGEPKRVTVSPRSFGTLPQSLTDHLDILVEGDTISAHMTLTAATKPRSYYVRLSCERGTVTVDFNTLTIVVESERGLPLSVSRMLSNYSKAYQLLSGGIKTAVGFFRKTVVPYQGLQILIPQYYESISTGATVPISQELTMAVSQTEEAIFSQAGKLRLNLRPRPSRQSEIRHKDRVLVTGASGYLGTELVRQLVEEGFYVRAFVRALSQVDRLEKLGIELIHGDVRDYDSLRSAAEGMDIIVHAAAALSGSKEFVMDGTVGGTKNVSRAAVDANVQRVIYISSMAVYDYLSISDGALISEESPLEKNPELRGVATLAKRLAENIALDHLGSDGPSWTIVRPALLFGNGREITSLVGTRVGNLIIRFGTRRRLMRLIHVRDVSSAIINIIQTDASQGHKYTLSHTDQLTTGEFVEKFIRQGQHPNVRVIYLPYGISRVGFSILGFVLRIGGKHLGMNKYRLAYACRSVGVDSALIMRDTGWQPSNSLLEQLKDEVPV